MLEWLFKKRRKEPPVLLDPAALLFSQATLCDALPKSCAEGQPPDSNSLVLHEDDWRQVEFVCQEDRNYLDGLLEEVRRFSSENWTGTGFKSVYVRQEHPTPLATKEVSMPDLLRMYAPNGTIGRLYVDFMGVSRVENGFALRAGPADVVYGVSVSDKISILAIQWDNSKKNETIARFTPFCAMHGLLLVDWYQIQILTS